MKKSFIYRPYGIQKYDYSILSHYLKNYISWLQIGVSLQVNLDSY